MRQLVLQLWHAMQHKKWRSLVVLDAGINGSHCIIDIQVCWSNEKNNLMMIQRFEKNLWWLISGASMIASAKASPILKDEESVCRVFKLRKVRLKLAYSNQRLSGSSIASKGDFLKDFALKFRFFENSVRMFSLSLTIWVMVPRGTLTNFSASNCFSPVAK